MGEQTATTPMLFLEKGSRERPRMTICWLFLKEKTKEEQLVTTHKPIQKRKVGCDFLFLLSNSSIYWLN
jgi:hypothetical protein